MNSSLSAEIKRQQARNLRYKKPMLPTLNMESMQNWLWDAQETCDKWAWVDDNALEALMDALDGNEDDYEAYQMAFATLSNDLDRFSSDLDNSFLPEYLDDVLVAIAGNPEEEILGFDTMEGDYFGLEDSYSKKVAIQESRERLKRFKKDELIEATALAMKVSISYLALNYRLDTLSVAVNILEGMNTEIISDTKNVNDLYEKMINGDAKAARDFDKVCNNLPGEAWIR